MISTRLENGNSGFSNLSYKAFLWEEIDSFQAM